MLHSSPVSLVGGNWKIPSSRRISLASAAHAGYYAASLVRLYIQNLPRPPETGQRWFLRKQTKKNHSNVSWLLVLRRLRSYSATLFHTDKSIGYACVRSCANVYAYYCVSSFLANIFWSVESKFTLDCKSCTAAAAAPASLHCFHSHTNILESMQ